MTPHSPDTLPARASTTALRELNAGAGAAARTDELLIVIEPTFVRRQQISKYYHLSTHLKRVRLTASSTGREVTRRATCAQRRKHGRMISVRGSVTRGNNNNFTTNQYKRSKQTG